jgi:hypothetical protein
MLARRRHQERAAYEVHQSDWNCIGEDEIVAFDDRADRDRDRRREHRARRNEGVELTILPARIDARGQCRQESVIVRASGETAIKLARVDRNEMSDKGPCDYFLR